MISVVVNIDSRPERDNNEKMFNGVVSRDFLVEGLINKRNLFKGFDIELVAFLDEHEPVDEKTLAEMREVCDTLIIRKHDKKFEGVGDFFAFNDLNYLQALFHSRGSHVFHFDGDVAAFTDGPEPIQEMIDWLDKYDYVSYPSPHSPNPVEDSSFGGKYWVSTRYFCCKRETLNFSELLKCQLNYDYWKEAYPVPRLCHWTEHLLSSISHHTGNGVFYPPVQFHKFILFTWENYHKYTLKRLNNQSFKEVSEWVSKQHFHYPNNLTIQ